MFRSANLMFSLIWHYTVPKHIFSLSSLRCMSIIVLSLTISVLGSSCNYLLILDLFSRLFNVCIYFLVFHHALRRKQRSQNEAEKEIITAVLVYRIDQIWDFYTRLFFGILSCRFSPYM